MFGALNRFISRLDSESPLRPGSSNGSGHGGYGFQVLRNTNEALPLEPWFDFIIGINGRPIPLDTTFTTHDTRAHMNPKTYKQALTSRCPPRPKKDNPDIHLFSTEIRNCAGASVTLGIYSAKGSRTYDIAYAIPATSPSLGLSLQWTPLSTSEDVWHILDVAANSPADVAGLLPYGDYIIGSAEGVVRGEAGLGELVEDHLSRPLRLLVYNHEYDVSRLVTITPTRHWGGDGALGCVLGFGALHRIPAPLTEPPQGPGETLFETHPSGSGVGSAAATAARFSNEEDAHHAPPATTTTTSTPSEFIIPASLPLSPPSHPASTTKSPSPSNGRAARKTRQQHQHHHHAISPGATNAGIDDYFREGEQKSRELDHAPSPRPSGTAPPPPPPMKTVKGGLPPPPKGPSPVAKAEREEEGPIEKLDENENGDGNEESGGGDVTGNGNGNGNGTNDDDVD
ncbi:MAG: hypothetical protein M1819_002662 [Sarea resinae]|nr:MAG: hypothetical protein M1819_002662 [Sarea resinae]